MPDADYSNARLILKHRGVEAYLVHAEDMDINWRDEVMGFFGARKNTRYRLGHEELSNVEEWRKSHSKEEYVFVPYWCYIHSGILFGIRPFDCPWDSAFCGYIRYAKKELAGFELFKLSGDFDKVARNVAETDVKTANDCMSGSFYELKLSISDLNIELVPLEGMPVLIGYTHYREENEKEALRKEIEKFISERPLIERLLKVKEIYDKDTWARIARTVSQQCDVLACADDESAVDDQIEQAIGAHRKDIEALQDAQKLLK